MSKKICYLLKVFLLVNGIICANGFLYGQSNIGSATCTIDTALLDPNYPAMKEWAKAGVEGGIPSASKKSIKKKLKPGNDIQQAIELVAGKGGGVVLLCKGIYPVYNTIHLRSNVILRGENKAQVKLQVFIHDTFKPYGGNRTAALHIGNQKNVGIENLTVEYKGASFEPLDRDSMNAPWDISVFHQPENRDTTLFTDLIWIDSSQNCWVQSCNLLMAGCDPMHISRSAHITCRGNYVDRCYNKNDRGMGYYNIMYSKYILIANEYIRRIRHLSIHKASSYVVIINNYLEVDINFHDGDKGNCLVQGNTVRIPTWHSWTAIQRGDPSKHHPPGPANYLFNNDAKNKDGQSTASGKAVVYEMNEAWKGGNTLVLDKPLPKGNTLYPMVCKKK